MAERKVLNFYIPPDFNPAHMPKGKRTEKNASMVNMMLPFTVRCSTCGEFMYKGKKMNAKKEDIIGQDYLGIRLFRFMMKCVSCSTWFSIRTDPANMDYAVESGVSRNFEPWRESRKEAENAAKARKEEEQFDAMKALENRTLDSKRQMDMLDSLDEIRTLRASQAKLGPDDVLTALQARVDEEQPTYANEDEEDAAAARAAFAAARGEAPAQDENSSGAAGGKRARPADDDDGWGGDSSSVAAGSAVGGSVASGQARGGAQRAKATLSFAGFDDEDDGGAGTSRNVAKFPRTSDGPAVRNGPSSLSAIAGYGLPLDAGAGSGSAKSSEASSSAASDVRGATTLEDHLSNSSSSGAPTASVGFVRPAAIGASGATVLGGIAVVAPTLKKRPAAPAAGLPLVRVVPVQSVNGGDAGAAPAVATSTRAAVDGEPPLGASAIASASIDSAGAARAQAMPATSAVKPAGGFSLVAYGSDSDEE